MKRAMAASAPDKSLSASVQSSPDDVRRAQESMNDTAAFLAEAGPVLGGRSHVIRRAVNTFLAFPFLFDLVIKDEDFAALMEGRVQRDWAYLLSRLLQK